MHKFLYNIATLLVKFHDTFLKGWVVQLLFSALILTGVFSLNFWIVGWLALGLVSYIFLTIKNHPKKGLPAIIKIYKDYGLLPFITGLNYAVLLGPLSLALDLLLSLNEPK